MQTYFIKVESRKRFPMILNIFILLISMENQNYYRKKRSKLIGALCQASFENQKKESNQMITNFDTVIFIPNKKMCLQPNKKLNR